MTERRQIMKTYRPDRKGLATLRLLILAFTVLLILAVNYFVPLRKAALIADISLATVSLLFKPPAVHLFSIFVRVGSTK